LGRFFQMHAAAPKPLQSMPVELFPFATNAAYTWFQSWPLAVWISVTSLRGVDPTCAAAVVPEAPRVTVQTRESIATSVDAAKAQPPVAPAWVATAVTV